MSLSSKKILVTGSEGMLGADLVPRLQKSGAELCLTSWKGVECSFGQTVQLDVSDLAAVQKRFESFRPDWVVNCAAFTQVDEAESNAVAALSVNTYGPANLAKAAAACSAKLVHVSTDYVFGGGSERCDAPYTESAVTNPCGVYGYSKALADELIAAILPEAHIIARTSWLYGAGGPNFVASMLRLGAERDELRVVDDQIGSPTPTTWLADALVQLMARSSVGTFNVSSRGGISWFEFAQEIFKQAKLEVELSTQTTEELGRPAPRPRYSVLDLSKLEAEIEQDCPDWRVGISEYLAK